MFFPVQIFMERVHGAALWRGLTVQAGWVFAMWLVATMMWRRGVSRYQAVGG
jgi:ABC-2 type transport system permease protein